MSGSTKIMAVITVCVLVITTAYTVALGSNGWLWFGLVVLTLVTIGVAATNTGTGPGAGGRPGRT
ncbi:hypothetical protein [Streptomyces purpureus]|uniref:Integral membrane protein n=1 Tax=Streptomyces purpureus TaxID=1951 RepID=A0A918H8Z2_9ACTN|nr:hypothetical protein [Streptomyces purpureus]GGT42658.1 hypothetical protein GCM10014713_40490 [Streptomyces purpureus]